MNQINSLLSYITKDKENEIAKEIINEYKLDLSTDQITEAFRSFRTHLGKKDIILSDDEDKDKYTFILRKSLTKYPGLFKAIILAPKIEYLLLNLKYLMVPEYGYQRYPSYTPAHLKIDNHQSHAVTMFLLSIHPFDITGLTNYSDTAEMFETMINLHSGKNTKSTINK